MENPEVPWMDLIQGVVLNKGALGNPSAHVHQHLTDVADSGETVSERAASTLEHFPRERWDALDPRRTQEPKCLRRTFHPRAPVPLSNSLG